MIPRLLRFSRAATLTTIVVLAWQVMLPVNMPHFDVVSLPLAYLAPAVSLAEITSVIAIVTYALAGWPNSAALRSGWRKVFALSLTGLVLYEALSISWSLHQGLAAVQVVHVAVWAAFAGMMICSDLPGSTMTLALLIGLLLHAAAGFIQISLRPVIEVIPQNSGISVVFSGSEHWQRVYGLSPHPNLLGGYLAIGVILICGLIATSNGCNRLWLIVAWLVCWITLLLTFSRSAWLAVIAGGLTALLLLRRGRHLNRAWFKLALTLAGTSLVVISAFTLWFQPFLVNRFDVTLIPFEAQAITERLNTAQLALQILAQHPFGGVGLAQSVVVMRDFVGAPIDWIHNVPLLAAAELGMGGLVLIALMLFALPAAGVQRWQTHAISTWHALIGGGLIALVVVMQFDHYVWTMAQGGLLWAWLAGWWLRADHTTSS